mgnify:CR=1 FL=1
MYFGKGYLARRIGIYKLFPEIKIIKSSAVMQLSLNASLVIGVYDAILLIILLDKTDIPQYLKD